MFAGLIRVSGAWYWKMWIAPCTIKQKFTLCTLQFQLQMEIVFNDCKNPLKIYGECVGHEKDLLDASFAHNSPNFDLSSKLSSIVLHGDNVSIVLPQNGFASEDLIGLQNISKGCIKYEWEDLNIAAFPCEVCVQPKHGYLKPGFIKLFRLSVKSLGSCMMLQTVPIKCSIFHYNKKNFREYMLPDGYFEFTEKGYYEKVLDDDFISGFCWCSLSRMFSFNLTYECS